MPLPLSTWTQIERQRRRSRRATRRRRHDWIEEQLATSRLLAASSAISTSPQQLGSCRRQRHLVWFDVVQVEVGKGRRSALHPGVRSVSTLRLMTPISSRMCMRSLNLSFELGDHGADDLLLALDAARIAARVVAEAAVRNRLLAVHVVLLPPTKWMCRWPHLSS